MDDFHQCPHSCQKFLRVESKFAIPHGIASIATPGYSYLTHDPNTERRTAVTTKSRFEVGSIREKEIKIQH